MKSFKIKVKLIFYESLIINILMNSPLQEITIGLPRDNLNHFDDFNSLKFHPSPYKIKKITVQFNNEEIWGLKILYVDGNGKEVKG